MAFVRRTFRALRTEHPIFFWGGVTVLGLLLMASIVVASRVPVYLSAARTLDSEMTEQERATRDRILSSRARRSEMAVALIQRELAIRSLEQNETHLAIDTERGVLALRHGPATLREAPVTIGPDSTIVAPDGRSWRFIRAEGERRLAEKRVSPDYTVPEWVYISRGEPVPPEAERTITGGLGRYVLTLDDGTEIYSRPDTGPFASGVKPASVVASEDDLQAIFDAIREHTPVFIY